MTDESQLRYNPVRSLGATLADVERIVASCDKQRFTLKPNPAFDSTSAKASPEPSHFLIRSNQGHSIVLASESLLTPITLEADNVPELVVHGTFFAYYPAIVASGGLKPMGRNHVHFATGLPGDNAVISGMRSSAELLVWVDVRRSLVEGQGRIRWWRSTNGVVLTEGDDDGLVPTRWWKRVEGHRANVGVLWEDGVKLMDLPLEIKGQKQPQIKGMRRNLILAGQRSEAMRKKDMDSNEGLGR